MTVSVIIILIVLGLFLILLELFVTPGIITGVLGGLAWVYALYNIYNIYGYTSGNLSLAGLILLLLACIIIAVKSGVWNKVSLSTSMDSRVNELPNLEVGAVGQTISMLRPSGKAKFNGIVTEVATLGEMIDSGKEIKIVRVENNLYIVELNN